MLCNCRKYSQHPTISKYFQEDVCMAYCHREPAMLYFSLIPLLLLPCLPFMLWLCLNSFALTWPQSPRLSFLGPRNPTLLPVTCFIKDWKESRKITEQIKELETQISDCPVGWPAAVLLDVHALIYNRCLRLVPLLPVL